MDVKKEWALRCALFLVGTLIIAFGINLNIMASFGVGGWDAYNIAMSENIGFTIGFWLNVNAVVYIILSAILRKGRLRIETFLTSILIGVFIDLWGLAFQGAHITGFWFQLFWFLLAIITISFGAGVYLVSKLPPNPIDELMLAISDRFHCNITISKTIVEGVGVIFGWILGGPIGLGTIIMLFIFGPIIQFFFRFMERKYESYLQEHSK